MAPRDRTTDTDTHDGPDDWFDDPRIDDTSTATDSSDEVAERRFTVLSDTSTHDDSIEPDWFDDDGAARVAPTIALDPESGEPIRSDRDSGEWVPMATDQRRGNLKSFDTRTSMLRAQSSPHTTAPRPPSWWRRHRAAVAVTSAVAVLGGGFVGAGLLLTGFTDDTAASEPMPLDEIVSTPAPTSTLPAAAGAGAADVTWCTGQADGQPVTEDSTDPGALAIWRFEKAFYYDRDSAAARAAGAPDAVMASAQRLQQGLDQLEPDIEFCVLADPVDAGVYDVTVVERGPGIDGRMSRQRITTAAQQDGQTRITAIVPR